MDIKIVEGRHDRELCAYCNDERMLKKIDAYADGFIQMSKMRTFFPVDCAINVLRAVKNDRVIMTDDVRSKVKNAIARYKKNVEKIEKIVSQYDPEVVKRVRDEGGDDGIYFDYKYRGKYPHVLSHQKIMYNMMRYCDCAALLSDPGTCKTAPYLWAIDTRIQLGDVKKALIVTLAALVPNIRPEIEVQAPHLTSVPLIGGADRVSKILNKSFSVRNKNSDYDIYIMSYESIRAYKDIIPDDYFQMVILDEAHRAGSPDSQQTQAIIDKFKYTPYKYIATGTLNANNLMSFFMPYRFMAAWAVPISNYFAFRSYYMKAVDEDQHIWVERKGSREIVSKIISRMAVVFKKEDCLDLPDLIYENIDVELSSEARQFYNSIDDELQAYMHDMCDMCDSRDTCSRTVCNNQVAIEHTQTRLIKLRQITSGFYKNTVVEEDPITGEEIDNSNYIWFKDNHKLNAMMSYITTLPSDKTTKIIVWCTFVKSVEAVAEKLRKVYGDKSVITCYRSDSAYDKEQEFKHGDARFIVAMDRKLGVGLNMQYSNYMLFYEKDHSLIKREQQLGRQHRKGQLRKVTAIDFSCTDTTDKEITKCLQNKVALASELEAYARVAKARVIPRH